MQKEPGPIKKNLSLIIVILVVIGAFILYTKYVKPSGNAASETASTLVPPAQNANVVVQQIMTLQSELNAIKFTTGTFDDKVFLHLIDYSVVIPAEPISRPNPFAPLSGSKN